MLEDYYQNDMPKPSEQIFEYLRALETETLPRSKVWDESNNKELGMLIEAIILYLDHRGILEQKTNR